MRQRLKIGTTDDRFYRQYLELVRVFPPLNGLSNAELNVLSEIMKYNNEVSPRFKDMEDDNKWPIIMGSDMRKVMRARLGMNEGSWNNALSALRRSGVLVDNKLTSSLRVYPQKMNIVSFEFNVKEEKPEVRVHQDVSGGVGETSGDVGAFFRELQEKVSKDGVYDTAGSSEIESNG